MRVLKKRDIIPEVAKEHNVSEDLVEAAVAMYWKEVITAVRELKHLNIKIENIGEMRMVRSRLEIIEEGLKKYLDKYDPESPQYKNILFKMGRMVELKKLRDIEYTKRNNVKSRREEYDKAKKGMEVQVENP